MADLTHCCISYNMTYKMMNSIEKWLYCHIQIGRAQMSLCSLIRAFFMQVVKLCAAAQAVLCLNCLHMAEGPFSQTHQIQFLTCCSGLGSRWMPVWLVIRRLQVQPCQVGNILSCSMIMKYFLRSFSPFLWVKKGSCQFLVKECA